MKKFAVCTPDGQILYTISPANDADFEGTLTMPDGQILCEIPLTMDVNPALHGFDMNSLEIYNIGPAPGENFYFNYKNRQWEDPRTPETEWPLVRAQRNALLKQSDWTQLPDVPLATKEAWATYRQALRDITNQPDPLNIVWPVPPG